MAVYDVAQICLHGHIINTEARRVPAHNQKFCKKCGAETITACPKCGTSIRGFCHESGVAYFGRGIELPSYCSECGVAYPWTTAKLEGAKELILESELSAEEQQELTDTLPDLMRETPRTDAAVLRFKRLVKKAGAEAGKAIYKVGLDLASAYAKSQMGV